MGAWDLWNGNEGSAKQVSNYDDGTLNTLALISQWLDCYQYDQIEGVLLRCPTYRCLYSGIDKCDEAGPFKLSPVSPLTQFTLRYFIAAVGTPSDNLTVFLRGC